MRAVLASRAAKPLVFILLLLPLALMLWRGVNDQLGANPIEAITRGTGLWTLRILIIALAITPIRRILHLPDLIRFRRMTGLFAFFYGALHFITYIWLDKFFDLADVYKDIFKRPFITVGFASFVLMLPLALTSTKGWIARLGGKRWQLIHRAVYFAALAGVIHFLWLVKSDVRSPALYGALLAILMGYRLWMWTRPA